jgi:hypothetical protein
LLGPLSLQNLNLFIKTEADKGRTAFAIMTDLKARYRDLDDYRNAALNVNLKRVQAFRKNYLKTMFEELSEVEHVVKLVKEADRQKYAVYPPADQAEGICDEKFFTIAFAPRELIQALATHGSDVVGLDGVYKLSVHRYVVWVLVFRHKVAQNGFIAAMAITNKDSGNEVYNFMDFIQEEVNQVLKIDFKRPDTAALSFAQKLVLAEIETTRVEVFFF